MVVQNLVNIINNSDYYTCVLWLAKFDLLTTSPYIGQSECSWFQMAEKSDDVAVMKIFIIWSSMITDLILLLHVRQSISLPWSIKYFFKYFSIKIQSHFHEKKKKKKKKKIKSYWWFRYEKWWYYLKLKNWCFFFFKKKNQ